MATQDDVRRIALSLPEAIEGGDEFGFSIMVKGKNKGFVWLWRERILPKKPKVPNPGVIVVRVTDEAEKQMLLASDEAKFFTEPHYNGYPAVLVRLSAIDVGELEEVITDSWRNVAPEAMQKELDDRQSCDQ